jgi:4-amino-4-deoxy-L-arabinose transferase-like glycosyltransferase
MEREDGRFGLGIALLFVAAIYASTPISPPHLMDDVDGVQAQISRTMLATGDWVTPRLDGVIYLEKPPLKYWMIASSYGVFGVHDWAARLPIVICILLTAWLVGAMGRWAFGRQAGFYSTLAFGSGVGLFLFTRVLISDILLTGTIALATWGLARALDEDEPRPRLWIYIAWASIGAGLLVKGLIAIVFPFGAAGLYLLLSGQLFTTRTWQRLRPFSGVALMLLVAAPWHILATLRNPPYLSFSMHAGPGQYRGFFWFYFFNEHVLRFLNRRWPHDYNTVPRHLFWLFHLLWFFPWSVYLPRLVKLGYRGADRASRLRLLCLCLAVFVMFFFSFSTTQEYYSLPIYPAVALLLGGAMVEGSSWIRYGNRVLGAACALALAGIIFILVNVWNMPAPGDISRALAQHPEMYTLSLGHMGDLTLASFAYLKLPLLLAGVAFAVAVVGGGRHPPPRDRVLDGAAAQRGTRRYDRLRPVPEQPAAGECSEAGAAGARGFRRSILHVQLGLLLRRRAEREAPQRPRQQPGVRQLRARRARRLADRSAVAGLLEPTATHVPAGRTTAGAALREAARARAAARG